MIGCTNKNIVSETIISLNPFKIATLDTGGTFTQLKILKIYPAQIDCNANEKYANLYICKKLLNGDSIYIFEECEKVPKFALDTNVNHVPVIDKVNVLIRCPNKVTVFVPADFRMPDGARYLFAKLSNLAEF